MQSLPANQLREFAANCVWTVRKLRELKGSKCNIYVYYDTFSIGVVLTRFSLAWDLRSQNHHISKKSSIDINDKSLKMCQVKAHCNLLRGNCNNKIWRVWTFSIFPILQEFRPTLFSPPPPKNWSKIFIR